MAELNDREHQLLELVAEGLTNRQIGARLYLSEKTVKNYVSAMLRSSRCELDRSGRLRHPTRRSSPGRDDTAAKRLS